MTTSPAFQALLRDLADVLERHGAQIETGWDCNTFLALRCEVEMLPAEAKAADLRALAAEIGERERRRALDALGDFLRAAGDHHRCARCGHDWTGKAPRYCPRCTSPSWRAKG